MRGVDRVVVRDGDAIGALLTRLGAHESVLAWEERRMRREVRATANRLANFDDANLRRSARAAVAAGARVQRALEILGDEVPEHLAAAGRLRMDHKQASLEELGALADPPLTKDAVAGPDPPAAGDGRQAGLGSRHPGHGVATSPRRWPTTWLGLAIGLSSPTRRCTTYRLGRLGTGVSSGYEAPLTGS